MTQITIAKLKQDRLKEKEKEYGPAVPYNWHLLPLLEHFFAEVGKMQHAWYHRDMQLFMRSLADVSNIHDMIIAKAEDLEAEDLRNSLLERIGYGGKKDVDFLS